MSNPEHIVPVSTDIKSSFDVPAQRHDVSEEKVFTAASTYEVPEAGTYAVNNPPVGTLIQRVAELEQTCERLVVAVEKLWNELMPKPIDIHDASWDEEWEKFKNS